ncbi:hypothetical protein CFOL_v3_30937 [Cephalotus follicularis]|uniref:Uncharacterized protein n=1 Tax=Cephalotus follicularis TaxID=3775 RepID=A0A1Q3D523_CEPFO|nr:hypothetical protein CFOL_v3_30937 [Cephalotus follicularis]
MIVFKHLQSIVSAFIFGLFFFCYNFFSLIFFSSIQFLCLFLEAGTRFKYVFIFYFFVCYLIQICFFVKRFYCYLKWIIWPMKKLFILWPYVLKVGNCFI